MADFEVQWDLAALNSIAEHSPELRSELERIGRDGVDYAKSIAPVDSGDYRDAFVHTVGHNREGLPVLAIANEDFKAWWIEAGTAPHGTGPGGAGQPVAIQGQHVLDRTLDHLRR